MYKIHPSSIRARNIIKNWTEQFPFSELNIGESFFVAIRDVNEANLRAMASKKGKQYNKRFAVIKDSEWGMLEVARVG